MCSTHCCFSFGPEWQEYECQRLAITPPFRSQLEEGSDLMGGMEWQTETMFPSQTPKKKPSLKLTSFSQLTIECLEDYILSFNRSSFQVRRNCHPIASPPRGFTIGHTFSIRWKHQPWAEDCVSLLAKSGGFLFTQGKIEGLWVKPEGFFLARSFSSFQVAATV